MSKFYSSEENRIESFENWPNWAKVAPDDLAKAGFYYLLKLDRVKCFACNVEIERWDKNEEPMAAHWKYSPNCPFLLSRGRSQPTMHGGGVHGGCVHGVGQTTGVPTVPHSQGAFPQEPGTWPSQGQTTGGPTVPHCHGIPPQDPGTRVSHPVQESFSGTHVPHAGPGEGAHGSRTGHGSHSQSSSSETSRQANIEEVGLKILTEPPHQGLSEYCLQDDLLELLPTARNPSYGHINSRITSFSTWTRQDIVRAKDLAEAGFYFMGEADKVCCFMCGILISGWKQGDVPWYEHNRWHSQCPYVTRCMKHQVVAAIVETAKKITEGKNEPPKPHHHGSGHTQCDADVISISAADWSSDNVKMLQKMGFSADKIRSTVTKHGKHVLCDVEAFLEQS